MLVALSALTRFSNANVDVSRADITRHPAPFKPLRKAKI
jgi:hypothetical protein